MNRKLLIAGLAGAAVLGFAGYGLYRAGVTAGQNLAVSGQRAPQKPGDIDPQTGKRILYWQDPMTPGQRFDHPGKSPLMDMALVPVVEGGTEGGAVTISPRLQQNLGVRVADVTRGRLKSEIAASATVVYDERDVALVQARANGFVERLRVRAAPGLLRSLTARYSTCAATQSGT